MGQERIRLGRRAENVPVLWRYFYNFKPSLGYALDRATPRGAEKDVVDTLRRDGIAITSVTELLGQGSLFDELAGDVAKLETERADEITRARADANDPDPAKPKTFLFEHLGKNPELDTESIYARFALQDPLIRIANSYFGMHTTLGMYNVWHNFPTDSEPRESQLWHRDRDDLHILKAFVYLSNIDEGSGPFTYAAGSHEGRSSSDPDFYRRRKAKHSDEEFAKIVDPSRWVKGTGPAGTIVFADTTGFHKGGLVRTSDRIMYWCKFTSTAGTGRTFGGYKIGEVPRDKAKQHAINPRKSFRGSRPAMD